MKVPKLGVFLGILSATWLVLAVPAYLHVAESTSVTESAIKQAKRVKGKITRSKHNALRGRYSLGVDIPWTYGIRSCTVQARDDEQAAIRMREIDVLVIPDSPVACATWGTLSDHGPRSRAGDALAAAALSLAAALVLVVSAGWLWRRASRRA